MFWYFPVNPINASSRLIWTGPEVGIGRCLWHLEVVFHFFFLCIGIELNSVFNSFRGLTNRSIFFKGKPL